MDHKKFPPRLVASQLEIFYSTPVVKKPLEVSLRNLSDTVSDASELIYQLNARNPGSMMKRLPTSAKKKKNNNKRLTSNTGFGDRDYSFWIQTVAVHNSFFFFFQTSVHRI